MSFSHKVVSLFLWSRVYTVLYFARNRIVYNFRFSFYVVIHVSDFSYIGIKTRHLSLLEINFINLKKKNYNEKNMCKKVIINSLKI